MCVCVGGGGGVKDVIREGGVCVCVCVSRRILISLSEKIGAPENPLEGEVVSVFLMKRETNCYFGGLP